MTDWQELFFGLFFPDPISAMIAVAFGYFTFRELKKNELQKNGSNYGEFDKVIFSFITGLILYMAVSKTIFAPIISFLSTLNFTNSPQNLDGFITTILFLLFLIHIAVYTLIDDKEVRSEIKIISELFFVLTCLILLSITTGSIFIAIYSPISSFRTISSDLLSRSLGLAISIMTTIIITILLSRLKITKDYLNEVKKLPFGKRSSANFFVLILFVTIALITLNSFFPKITYGDEQKTAYVLDVGYNLGFGINDIPHRKLFEHVIQPTSITQSGMLGTIFIENRGRLIVNSSLRGFVPSTTDYETGPIIDTSRKYDETMRIKTSNLDELIGNGITNISYNEKYGGFVIKFDNLDNYNLTNTDLGGYRKVNVSTKDFDLVKEENEDKSLVKIFVVNNLNAPVVHSGNIDTYNYTQVNKTCILTDASVIMHNLSSGDILESYANLDIGGADVSILLKNMGVWYFALRENVLYPKDIEIPAHTNISMSLRVLCN